MGVWVEFIWMEMKTSALSRLAIWVRGPSVEVLIRGSGQVRCHASIAKLLGEFFGKQEGQFFFGKTPSAGVRGRAVVRSPCPGSITTRKGRSARPRP